jgi:hypothetical protein
MAKKHPACCYTHLGADGIVRPEAAALWVQHEDGTWIGVCDIDASFFYDDCLYDGPFLPISETPPGTISKRQRYATDEWECPSCEAPRESDPCQNCGHSEAYAETHMKED